MEEDRGVLAPQGSLIPGVARIAVLRANSIGDFVMAVPALEALRAAYPDAAITYLGEPWHPDLLEGRPGPWDDVVVVPPYPGVRGGPDTPKDSPEVAAFFAGQRRRRYDLAVQMHGGGENSNPFIERLGARVTVGARDLGARALDRWVPYVAYQHEVIRFLEVAGLVGAVPTTLEPRLAVTEADKAAAAAMLPFGEEPIVAVHPGANDSRRRWPSASFAAVADALATRGARVVVVGTGAEDADAATEIAAAMRAAPLDLTNRLSLSGLMGVVARSTVLLGNDSGPRHLAAAAGTATVSVYWAGNLINAGPLTRTRHRIAVSFQTHCPVCGAEQAQGRCPHNPSYVADLTVDDVLPHAVALFEQEVARGWPPAAGVR